MRERWQTVSRLWEDNKALANRLEPAGEAGLRAQPVGAVGVAARFRTTDKCELVYTKAGEPTAALLEGSATLVDHLLYWIPCRTIDEANYLLAIINSDALQEGVRPLMSKGQFGARDLHKHLWKLPIPEFDPSQKNCTQPSRRLGQRRQL